MATSLEVKESALSVLAYQLTLGTAKIKLLGAMRERQLPVVVSDALIIDAIELHGLVCLMLNLLDREGVLTLETVKEYLKGEIPEDDRLLYGIVESFDKIADEFKRMEPA